MEEISNNLLGRLEAVLFSANRSLSLKDICQFLNVSSREAQELINRLNDYYLSNHRGLCIMEIAGGFRMVSNPLYGEELKSFFSQKKRIRLSQAALEVLAIVAYRQPVTRREIAIIRGQVAEDTLKGLLEKGFIKIGGRKKTPGRPYLYRTTDKFLEVFGLRSLKDLPPLKNREVQDGLKEFTQENR